MDTVTSQTISLIEANYDLEASASEWLDGLTSAGATTFDQGLGFSLDEYTVSPCEGGAVLHVRDLRTISLADDYASRFRESLSLLTPQMVADISPPGYAGTWTEISQDYPDESKAVLDVLGYSDMLGILASDPKGEGIRIMAPLPAVTRLTPRSRRRWKMLGAHIASAYRLRRALQQPGAIQVPRHALPGRAEAILDPQRFRLIDARGPGKEVSAADVLRSAARRIDRARSTLRKEDPAKALHTWQALVCGRWSLVDWFDTDQRRFIIALPNPPDVRDPRGLSEQECQVVEYAALGDSNKLIAYRLGLSQSRVSVLLHSAMTKLGIKSRAELATRLPPFHVSGAEADSSVA